MRNRESPSELERERERSDSIQAPLDLASEQPDTRSPLERFRTKPQKALSVTDLVSPTWCELQYWYTLTKHGKKRRTPAMRQGSVVHKTLEEQVHRTVPVDTKTREDTWGLRLWNTIEGLKTLRETGMTRELEIWGVVDGLVVNGVIDELSYICPDRSLEEEAIAKITPHNGMQYTPSPDQTSISSFFKQDGSASPFSTQRKSLRSLLKKTSRVYLADVKTRGGTSKSIPKGASFRPALMQMMLYRRLLSDLATNKVDASILFNRYELDPSAHFSDGFIAQIGSLNETFYEAPLEPSQSSQEDLDNSQDSIQILLEHNSLRQLWSFMIEEFSLTMPAGEDSIGDVLKIEYRAQDTGDVFGFKTFLYDKDVINDYLDDELRWWRGEREAVGVSIEEAFKCRTCEFAEGCSWRESKIEEATNAHRTRSRSII